MNKRIIIVLISIMLTSINTLAKEIDISPEIENIKNYNKAGLYTIEKENKEIKAAALKRKVINSGKIQITAIDFMYNTDKTSQLNDDEIIRLTQAKAKNLDTNKKLPIKVVRTKGQCVFECNDEEIKVMIVSDGASNTVSGYDAKTTNAVIHLGDEKDPAIRRYSGPTTYVIENNEDSERVEKVEKEELKETVSQVSNNDDEWTEKELFIEKEQSPVENIAKGTSVSFAMGLPLVIIYGQYTRISRKIRGIIQMFISN